MQRILVVEDEPDLRKVLATLLRRGGYTVDLAENGKAGSERLSREIYDLVLAAQAAAIAAVKSGNSWDAPHRAAVQTLAQGMIDLKLLAGSVAEVVETEAYRKYYMHRTGHWLGLDVHDAGEYKRSGQWRALAPGMTLTVEPGLYVRAADDVPAACPNIGVRIEDDVAVTAEGCEVLTAEAPKAVDDIEALMREVRPRD